MKKLLSILMLCILFQIFTLGATKGTMDESKARQAILDGQMKYQGWGYPPNIYNPSPHTIDCSHLYNAGLSNAGLKGPNGKGYATTQNMRSSGMMKNLSASQLKPGDAIVTYPTRKGGVGHVRTVRRVLPNGQIEVMDSHSGKGFSIYTMSYPPKNYAGVISVTDMIIANGYTPINSSGQVVVPPAASIVGIGSGSVSSGSATQPVLKNTLDIDFNKISNRIVEFFVKGTEIILPDLTILLSILFAFELYFFFYEGFSGVNEKFMIALIRKILKFVFYLTVLNNYLSIITFMYNFFLGIAEDFLGSTTAGVFNPFNFLYPLNTLSNLILTIIILIFTFVLTVRYLLEIFMVKTQFFLVSGLASIFLPFEVFEKTKDIGGSRTLKAIFGSGMLVMGIAITGTICYEIMQDFIMKETFFENIVKSPEIFYYIIVIWIMFGILKSTREMLSYIMR